MGGASGLLATLQGLNLAKMGGLFVLNFIGGYLVYASIFAAIGAAINGQEDSQQFMMPIVLLLIFALYAGIYSSDNPDGTVGYLVFHDSVYFTYCHDGASAFRCTGVGNDAVCSYSVRCRFRHDLDSRKDLSGRYPDVWKETFFQGNDSLDYV